MRALMFRRWLLAPLHHDIIHLIRGQALMATTLDDLTAATQDLTATVAAVGAKIDELKAVAAGGIDPAAIAPLTQAVQQASADLKAKIA